MTVSCSDREDLPASSCSILMGTLVQSVNYEREQRRLPPLDPARLTELSSRRVASVADMLHRHVNRIDEGKHLAQSWAAKSNAEVEALRMIGLRRQETVREARNMLIASASAPTLTAGTRLGTRNKRAGTSEGPRIAARVGELEVTSQRAREAQRETARDSLRREQMMEVCTRFAMEAALDVSCLSLIAPRGSRAVIMQSYHPHHFQHPSQRVRLDSRLTLVFTRCACHPCPHYAPTMPPLCPRHAPTMPPQHRRDAFRKEELAMMRRHALEGQLSEERQRLEQKQQQEEGRRSTSLHSSLII